MKLKLKIWRNKEIQNKQISRKSFLSWTRKKLISSSNLKRLSLSIKEMQNKEASKKRILPKIWALRKLKYNKSEKSSN